MFDHVTIRVSDREASERFYDTVLQPLAIEQSYRTDTFSEWHDFSLALAEPEHPVTRRLHFGFVAPSRERVEEFWRAGTEAGYTDDGPPGPRPQYTEDYYGAFLLDPDGNSAEAVHYGSPRRGGIVDHVWVGVADLAAAKTFYETIAPHAALAVTHPTPDRVRVAGESGSLSLLRGTHRPSTSTSRSPPMTTPPCGTFTRPRSKPDTSASALPASGRSVTRATTPPTPSTPTATTSRSSTTTASDRVAIVSH
jgi:catechol 2,3-dioxygenase-like lactoylglutathione lyase family enzyme